MDIGFLGVGLMGVGMAACLRRAGHAVRVAAHRERGNVERLVAAGCIEEDGPQAVAAATEVLFLCLPNAEVVARTLDGLAPHLKPGGLVIDATTSLPETSRHLAVELGGRQVGFVDAPVTGGPPKAEDGTLTSMVGATAADFARARPLIEHYSETVVHIGPPGTGNMAKLIHNFIAMGQVSLVVEAMRRCDRVGIARDKMYEVVSTGGANSNTLRKMVPSALAGTYDGHRFSLENAAKDVAYIREVAESTGEESLLIPALSAFFERELQQFPGDVFLNELLRK